MLKHAAALACLTVVLNPMVAQRAHACSPIAPGETVPLPAPANDATDVPLNTLIWLDGGTVDPAAGLEPALVDDADSAVPLTTTQWGALGGQPFSVLHPSTTLAANTHYRVLLGSAQLTAFTTGTSTLSAAPEMPQVLGTKTTQAEPAMGPVLAGSCGPASATARFTLNAQGAMVLVDVNGTTTFVEQGLSGLVSDVVPAADDAQVLVFGASETQEVAVRFASLDLTGGFSGWTEPVTVRLEGNPGPCTCSTVPSTGRALAVVLGALAFVWRGRRRRHGTPATH